MWLALVYLRTFFRFFLWALQRCLRVWLWAPQGWTRGYSTKHPKQTRIVHPFYHIYTYILLYLGLYLLLILANILNKSWRPNDSCKGTHCENISSNWLHEIHTWHFKRLGNKSPHAYSAYEMLSNLSWFPSLSGGYSRGPRTILWRRFCSTPNSLVYPKILFTWYHGMGILRTPTWRSHPIRAHSRMSRRSKIEFADISKALSCDIVKHLGGRALVEIDQVLNG